MGITGSIFELEIARVGVVCLVGYIVNMLINSIYEHTVKTTSINIKYIKNIIQATVVICCVVVIFDTFDGTKRFTKVILASSGLMVAVSGFAAQESIGNIINGLFISIFKPFEIGDRINLLESNITGIIEDISLRHTVLRTFTNSRVIIPNSIINKEIIENSHFMDTRAGNFLDVRVSYDSDIDKAMEIISRLVGEHPLFLDSRSDEDIENGIEKVPVFVRELDREGVVLRATVWTSRIETNFKTCSDLRLAIKREFDKYNIEIPYNHVKIVS